MRNSYEKEINEEFLEDARMGEKNNGVLNETFKKAEISDGLKLNEKKINKKRPFLKSGILILVIAIICLVVIDNTPWVYVKYQDQNLGVIEEALNRDLTNEKYENIENPDSTSLGSIKELFESQCNNCSDNSQHFIGLSIDDFSYTSGMTFIAFLIIAILAIIFIALQLIDKILRRFSIETVAIIHSMFAAGIILASTFVLLLTIKFLGTYLLIFYNGPFIPLEELRIIFIAPIILFVFAAVLVKGGTSIVKMNFNELKTRFKTEIPEDSFSVYRIGGKPK